VFIIVLKHVDLMQRNPISPKMRWSAFSQISRSKSSHRGERRKSEAWGRYLPSENQAGTPGVQPRIVVGSNFGTELSLYQVEARTREHRSLPWVSVLSPQLVFYMEKSVDSNVHSSVHQPMLALCSDSELEDASLCKSVSGLGMCGWADHSSSKKHSLANDVY
jgi:hypothetical protein